MEGQSMNETTGQELQRQSRKQVRRLQEANDRLADRVRELEDENERLEKLAGDLESKVDEMQLELDRSQPMAD